MDKELQQKLDERTPLSAGITTDNPIFVALMDAPALTKVKTGWITVMVLAGSQLRLLACEQTPHASPYLYKGMVVTIPNQFMQHVEGDLGPQHSDTYQLVDDEFQTVK